MGPVHPQPRRTGLPPGAARCRLGLPVPPEPPSLFVPLHGAKLAAGQGIADAWICIPGSNIVLKEMPGRVLASSASPCWVYSSNSSIQCISLCLYFAPLFAYQIEKYYTIDPTMKQLNVKHADMKTHPATTPTKNHTA